MTQDDDDELMDVRGNRPLVRAVLFVALANLAYFGVEFGVARAIGSVSLFADSIDFLEDTSINLLILLGLGWSARNRARLGMMLALVLLVPGLATLWTAWQKFNVPVAPDPIPLTLAALGALAVNLIEGTKADEFALIVARADGATLIINDILSSVSHPEGIGANIMARLFGFGVDHPRTSRLIRHMYVDDPKAVARQFRRWATIPDLRRLIVSHVDIISEEPAQVLKEAASDLD